MAMGQERSKPLHNFVLPYGLKWGNQRHLRCSNKVESNGEISTINRMSNGSESMIGMVDRRRGSNDRLTRKFRSPGKEDDDSGDGIGAVREKLMFDLLTEADKMKNAIFKEGMEEELSPAPAQVTAPVVSTTLTGAVSDAAELSRPWNLRTRRAACKEPNGFVAGAGAGTGGSKIDTIRTNAPSANLRSGTAGGGGLAGAFSVGEKRRRVKFSVPLSRREIDEDFMSMIGHRPPRRPKKRAKLVQKNLDTLFPGLWLTEIRADLYKVSEDQ